MPLPLFDKQLKAIYYRKQGKSLSEIAQALHVAKSSVSLWVKHIQLSSSQKIWLQKRIERGQKKGIQLKEAQIKKRTIQTTQEVQKILSSLHLNSKYKKLLCSIFFWTEGSKNPKNRVSFTNSDPIMIQTYLSLFRSSFPLDEKKFRALIHIHDYHNDDEMKKYWSSLTRIPLQQFYKSYRKYSSHKTKKEGYKGTICITYYNSKVALELTLLYNYFAKQIRGII